MANKIKIQHYVPRFYLRNFAIKKKNDFFINCFDKPSENKFVANIKSIGAEKYFYDLPKDVNQDLEKSLAKIEGIFSKVCKKLVEKEYLNTLTLSEKSTLSLFIATQWLRTKENRENLKDTIKQLEKRLSNEKLSPKLKKQIEAAKTEKAIKNLHIRIMQSIPEIAEIILNMKWMLIINKTGMPYWTSDHPVSLHNDINLYPYGNLGLTSKGIQIYFPLTPKISLCICDPVRYKILPNKHEAKDEQNIIFQNHLQVKWSTRHLFSINSDFSLAEKMVKENSYLKDISRKRVSVT